MPSIKISKEMDHKPFFLTMTVKNWYYLFDRHSRWEILLKSLRFCQKNKNLKVSAWVFMMNHIHLIVQSDDVSGFVRDFKTFTSKEIKKNLLATEPNVLDIFLDADGKYELWQKTNMPKAIETGAFFQQKVEYIEHNPVRKTYVKRPEDWIWSSANTDALLHLDHPWEE